MWANKYIGIPFKANGRTKDGLDCWGLVRLVYKEEYDIELPSLDTDYSIEDDSRIHELVAQYKEGWTTCAAPEPGSVVLFRILGEQQHLGITIDTQHFIHVREGGDSAVEKFSNPKWSKRIVGYYKYTPGTTDITLVAAPHPLKTEKITVPVPAGTSIQQVYEWLQKKYSSTSDIVDRVHIILNGKVVPKETWAITTISDGDTLEYRAVAGKSGLRIILTLIVAYIAFQIAGPKAAAWAAEAGFAKGTFVAFAAQAVAVSATMAIGMKLVDAIAPIRMGDQNGPGDTKNQYLFSGGSNQANRYAPIPVILGKIRMTPPLGANIFVDYEQRSTSYLNTVLVWGYGPLQFYKETYKIGNKDITSFYGVTEQTITGYDVPAEILEQQVENFNRIYPQDLEQIYSGFELAWKGTPDPNTVGAFVDPVTGEYDEDDVDPDRQPDYFYDSAGTNYLELGLGTVNPNASRIFEIPQAVADQRQNLIVTYYWGDDGNDGSQGG